MSEVALMNPNEQRRSVSVLVAAVGLAMLIAKRVHGRPELSSAAANSSP